MRIVCDCGVTAFDSNELLGGLGFPSGVCRVVGDGQRYIALSVAAKPGTTALVVDCACGVRVIEICGIDPAIGLNPIDVRKIAALWQVWVALMADADYADCVFVRHHDESCVCLDCTIFLVATILGTNAQE